MVHMKDTVIYTDTTRFAIVDGALYEHASSGIKGLLFKIESFVRMDDGSVIVRGEDYNVTGADKIVSLGFVRDTLEMRVTVDF